MVSAKLFIHTHLGAQYDKHKIIGENCNHCECESSPPAYLRKHKNTKINYAVIESNQINVNTIPLKQVI